MKTAGTITAIVFVLGVLPLTGCGRSESGAAKAEAKYHCPMHPTVVSDKPGDCPICGMRLVPMEPAEGTAAPAVSTPAPAKSGKVVKYRSTMNLGEISDRPGKDSMGMEMVPFEIEEAGETAAPGLATVSITPAARARMGLTLGHIERRTLARQVRTSAIIVPDETRLWRVTTKVEGWVEKLFVNVTGQPVTKGDALLEIYSPELVRAQQEYLTALGQQRALGDTAGRSGVAALVEATRRRFEFWDISEEQIRRLEQTGKVERTLTLAAPASGYVLQKNVLAGQKIMPGEALLVVGDLSRVWADADVYPSDLPYVKVGMPMRLRVPYGGERTFEGKVIFVSPTLEAATRTAKARLEIGNEDGLLKPGMYADALLDLELGEGLAIPESAVMRTGERTYAFKDTGGGGLVPVVIEIGGRADGWFQLLGGLAEGDRVVTSANFLVDSESSLQAALQAVAGPAPSEASPAAGEHRH